MYLKAHLLSGITDTESYSLNIDSEDRHNLILRDQEGKAKEIYQKSGYIRTILSDRPDLADIFGDLSSDNTENFTSNLPQQTVIKFLFKLRAKCWSFVRLAPFLDEDKESETGILFAKLEIDWHDKTEYSSGPVHRGNFKIKIVKKEHEMPPCSTSEQEFEKKKTPVTSNRHRSYTTDNEEISRGMVQLTIIDEDAEHFSAEQECPKLP